MHAQCPLVTLHIVQLLTDPHMHSSVPNLEIGYVMVRWKTLNCFRYYCKYHDDQLAISRAENSE